MFCPKCGNELPENAKFCGKCGAVLKSDEASPKKTGGGQAKETKAALHKVLNQLQNIWSGYTDVWRRCRTLEGREKNLWFGIHGVAAVLLLCLVLIPVFSGASSGNGDKIAAAFYKAAEDGQCSEEEIANLAQLVTDYEDICLLHELSIQTMVLNTEREVAEECRNLSGLGVLTEECGSWYDGDGLTEKIYGMTGNIDYLIFGDGCAVPDGEDTDLFREAMWVEWYTYPDSDRITFVIEKYTDTSAEKQRCDGRFEISDGDILITLDKEQYRLTQAAADIAARNEELFRTLAKGTWGYSQEFYDMIASRLGKWEVFQEDMEPLYMEFFPPTGGLTIMGSNHVYLEHIRRCEYEQGEGKTVTIVSGDSRLEISYEKVGNNLVIKADGQEYVLSPATVVITDQEQLHFGG